MKSKTEAEFLRELEARYRCIPHEEVVQILMAMTRWHFEERNRRKDGGKKKAAKLDKHRFLAKVVFFALTENGRKASAQDLFNELNRRFPAMGWNYNTVRGWHRAIKEALAEDHKNT